MSNGHAAVDYTNRVRGPEGIVYTGIRSRRDAVGSGMVEQPERLETAPDPWETLPPIKPPF